MRLLLSIIVLLASISGIMVGSSTIAAERESYYSSLICEHVYNGFERQLPSGLRPDCETTFGIIEFDWAKSPKHYECIGQALIYSQQTGKLPVCVLLARDDEELEFGRSLEFSEFGVILHVMDARLWDPLPTGDN